MEELRENMTYSDLIAFQLNKGVQVTLAGGNQNDYFFSNGVLVEMQNLKNESITLRKEVEGSKKQSELSGLAWRRLCW